MRNYFRIYRIRNSEISNDFLETMKRNYEKVWRHLDSYFSSNLSQLRISISVEKVETIATNADIYPGLSRSSLQYICMDYINYLTKKRITPDSKSFKLKPYHEKHRELLLLGDEIKLKGNYLIIQDQFIRMKRLHPYTSSNEKERSEYSGHERLISCRLIKEFEHWIAFLEFSGIERQKMLPWRRRVALQTS